MRWVLEIYKAGFTVLILPAALVERPVWSKNEFCLKSLKSKILFILHYVSRQSSIRIIKKVILKLIKTLDSM